MLTLGDLQPTAVFDTYWRFACERQRVYMLRLLDEPRPWTEDPIISGFRFTNAYRACDRVSQYLINHVIYDAGYQDRNVVDTVLRILLFKFFNRIETWQHIESKLGPVSERSFNVKQIASLLDATMKRHEAVYSGAYIIPPVTGLGKTLRKHLGHLRLLEKMLLDGLASRLTKSRSLSEVYSLLLSYPGLGPFLAFQLSIDLNYSGATSFDEMSFVVAGPGARSGVAKCFARADLLPPEDIIRLVAESQHAEMARRGLRFPTLPGRDLQLVDCQNLFCEVDKYARVAHPEVVDPAGRTRIKQSFRPVGPVPKPAFPPKWRVGDVITTAKESASWTLISSSAKLPKQTSILLRLRGAGRTSR